jgi:putative ABC transport system permease protein
MAFFNRLLGTAGRHQLDSELDDEVRSHIDMRTEELVASGVPADEARRQAVVAFGNRAYVKEEARSFDTVQWLESMVQDVRFGFRQLFRNPGFTLIAALTLALGIGANTAIFTVVNAVLLRPLPYANPGRLVGWRSSHSLPDVIDVGRMSKTLQDSGGWASWYLDLTSSSAPEQIDAALIGGNVFPTLGVAPYLGSTFDDADDVAGKTVVVASYDFWQTHLGGDRAAIGRTLPLSGNSYTLVGVMPPGFHLPNSTSQLWVPFRVGYPEATQARGAHFMTAISRMRDGVTIAQVNEELAAIGKRLGEMHPEEARTFSVMGMRERFTGDVRTPLLVLLGAVSLVLLIACSNFATLLLARGASRHSEIQVRSALGARPLRIIRQLVTESVVLSGIAGLIGIGFAYAGMRALLALTPEDTHKLYVVSLDTVALAFTFAISVLTGVIFGVMPAFQAVREGRVESAGARVVSGRTTTRSVLVVAEMALALVLLTGAGLLIRSLWQIQSVPLGMNPDGLLTMRLTLPASRYGPIPVQQQFLQRLNEQMRDVPGVESSGLVSELPLSGWRMMHNMLIEGLPEPPPGREPEIYTHEISPGLLPTVGAQLISGRNFTDQDDANAPLVGIVNEAFVKEYLTGRDPLGARARWARTPKPMWMTIVGVVRDVRFDALDAPQEPTIYTPYLQKQQPWKRFTAIVLRPKPGMERAVADAVKQKVWSVDPQLPVTHVFPMTEVMRKSVEDRRLITLLLAAFAALAVVLSMMGVYGVIAYIVTERRREVGVRVALGAKRSDILWLIIRQGLPLLAAGLILGSAGALGSTRVLRKLLYATSATDLPTFAVVAALLAFVGLLAMIVPAIRAMRIDPMTALRAE